MGLHCGLARLFAVLILALFSACLAFAQGTLDPEVEKVPFQKWLSEEDQLHFRWTVKVPRAEISFHQRLQSSIDIRLDGRDLDSRRHDGKLLLFLQITDSGGQIYQDHGEIALDKLNPDVKDAFLDYSQRAFFVPGDYRVAVVIEDVATAEHAATQLEFRVPAPQHFWLVDAWRELPSVEYIGDEGSPESWYLPYIQGRLAWAAGAHSGVQLNVVLNVSAAARVSAGNMAALLPALKMMSIPGSAAVSERIAVMDLSRRKTVFEQSDAHDLDWPRLKSALGNANTASIDLHSLAGAQNDAQFFVTEVRRVLRESPGKPCALVVLSAPVHFEAGEDLEPISLEALPACHVVYIRYHVARAVRPMNPAFEGMGRRSRMGGA